MIQISTYRFFWLSALLLLFFDPTLALAESLSLRDRQKLELEKKERALRRLSGEDLLKAAQLKQCFHGHDTLNDIEIVYGKASREVIEKAKGRKVILGGAMIRPRKHWVVCQTCKLRYDDNKLAWYETKQLCSEQIAREFLTEKGIGFPVIFKNTAPKEISTGRWLADKQIQGAFIALWTEADTDSIIQTLNKWTPKGVQIVAPKNDNSGRAYETVKWEDHATVYELTLLSVFEENKSHINFEWIRKAK